MAQLQGKNLFLEIGSAEKTAQNNNRNAGGAGKKLKESWETGAADGSPWQFFSSLSESGEPLEERHGRCVLCARHFPLKW